MKILRNQNEYHDYRPGFGGKTQWRGMAHGVLNVLFTIDDLYFERQKGKGLKHTKQRNILRSCFSSFHGNQREQRWGSEWKNNAKKNITKGHNKNIFNYRITGTKKICIKRGEMSRTQTNVLTTVLAL